MQRGDDWCLACEFDRRFCRALRGLRACWHPAYAFGSLACWAAPGWRGCWCLACMVDGHCRQIARGMRGCQPLACLLGARCWGMVCCVCLAALHRAYGGWASCLRQSILTSGFHVWGPMCRRGFRARRLRSCGLRTEQRAARYAVRCTGCFPAWKLFPR